jgi:hypothetical protein
MRESRQTCVKIHSFENHTHLTKRTQQHECMCRQINSRQIGDSFDSTAKHFSCRYLKFVLLSASSLTQNQPHRHHRQITFYVTSTRILSLILINIYNTIYSIKCQPQTRVHPKILNLPSPRRVG